MRSVVVLFPFVPVMQKSGARDRMVQRDPRAPHHEVAPLELPGIVPAEAHVHAERRELGRERPRRLTPVAQPHVEPVPREQARGGGAGAPRAHDQRAAAGQKVLRRARHWSLNVESESSASSAPMM